MELFLKGMESNSAETKIHTEIIQVMLGIFDKNVMELMFYGIRISL